MLPTDTIGILMLFIAASSRQLSPLYTHEPRWRLVSKSNRCCPLEISPLSGMSTCCIRLCSAGSRCRSIPILVYLDMGSTEKQCPSWLVLFYCLERRQTNWAARLRRLSNDHLLSTFWPRSYHLSPWGNDSPFRSKPCDERGTFLGFLGAPSQASGQRTEIIGIFHRSTAKRCFTAACIAARAQTP